MTYPTQQIETPSVLRGTVFYEFKTNAEQRGTGHKYENEVAGIYVPFEVPSGLDLASLGTAVTSAASAAFAQAKITVYSELGLGFNIADDGQVYLQTLEQVAPAAPAAAAPVQAAAFVPPPPPQVAPAAPAAPTGMAAVAEAFPQAQPVAAPLVSPAEAAALKLQTWSAPMPQGAEQLPTPPWPTDTTAKAEKDANTCWALYRLANHPDEFYDNRPKKASGQFKAKAPDFKHKTSEIPIWL